jgi:hypothetical protein
MSAGALLDRMAETAARDAPPLPEQTRQRLTALLTGHVRRHTDPRRSAGQQAA